MAANLESLDYPGLMQVFRRNARLRSIAECEEMLATIEVLEAIRPAEQEHAGERLSTRALDATRQRALKRLGAYKYQCRRPVAIITQDNLRTSNRSNDEDGSL